MTPGFSSNWTTQARKGVLELCILNALTHGRMYGYEIVRRLRELDGLLVSEGTVYPILSRFRSEAFVRVKLVESADGPARKYYELSAAGQRQLEWMNRSWTALTSAVEALQKGG